MTSTRAISLDTAPFTGDMVHESAKHALEQRKKHAAWLDVPDPVVVANAMLIILSRAINMLNMVKSSPRASMRTAYPLVPALMLVLQFLSCSFISGLKRKR